MRKPRRRGISLLEVILALAVFGLVAFLVSLAFRNTLLSLSFIAIEDNDDDHLRFVRQQIVMMTDREEIEDGGEITLVDGRQADWEADIEQGPVSDLFYLDLTINIEALDVQDEPTVAVQNLMILRPDWSIEEDDTADVLQNNRERLEDRRRQLDFVTDPL